MPRESYQNESPPSRVTVEIVMLASGKPKKELPLKLLMPGNYKGREPSPDDPPLAEREKISVDKNNFSNVMKALNLWLRMVVLNRLAGGDEEMVVELKFDDLKSFEPESVARQVPELNAILAVRNLLAELKDYLITKPQFRRELERIFKSQSDLDSLSADLERLVPQIPGAFEGVEESKSGGERK
jgi:type VI secretion system protein ImpB